MAQKTSLTSTSQQTFDNRHLLALPSGNRHKLPTLPAKHERRVPLLDMKLANRSPFDQTFRLTFGKVTEQQRRKSS
uniref:Uncharacterized protein n=1 Tax=Helianthus annuus TaxID=4232 RepID=A0A251V326_HELAN